MAPDLRERCEKELSLAGALVPVAASGRSSFGEMGVERFEWVVSKAAETCGRRATGRNVQRPPFSPCRREKSHRHGGYAAIDL
jgi:hypothetical protein